VCVTSHPTSRTLALLALLQAHHRLTGDELAARLGVDPRTVRRYATRLAELGIPLVAERGRYGGYRLAPGYRLPPLMLTEDEAVAVVLGLLAGQRVGLSTAAPAVDTALAKIRRVLPTALAARVTAVAETLTLTLRAPSRGAPAGGDGTVGALLTLAEATRERRRVRVAYRSWRGEDSERELDPYGLVFHSGRWYATGFDHRRGEVRSFRLDRMRSVEPTGRRRWPGCRTPTGSRSCSTPTWRRRAAASHRRWPPCPKWTVVCCWPAGPSTWTGWRRCWPAWAAASPSASRTRCATRSGCWPIGSGPTRTGDTSCSPNRR
jgi:predicted DNA-binding transcriptional regulator YafY